jgi:saccharopine dehydrogenase-like NADP-dependent oxidoreductase
VTVRRVNAGKARQEKSHASGTGRGTSTSNGGRRGVPRDADSSRPPRITVVGGAGAMGRIIVRDLVETAPDDIEIALADYDKAAALAVVRGLPRRRGRRAVLVQHVDVTRKAEAKRALAGTTVLVNACHHSFNLRLMDIALACGSHYTDLGGLFHVTREQLRLHQAFARAGRLAICGMGSAPGIVNVMARAAADRLETVSEIHIAVGTIDRTPRRHPGLLATSYTIHTVLDEASQPAALFTGGTLRFVEPLSGADAVDFPAPVGRQYPARTLHSELATLPVSFKKQGVREVSFRIAFPGELTGRLRFLHGLGMTATTPLQVDGTRVVPRDVLLALLAAQPASVATGPVDEYEVLRVTVRGRRAGESVEIEDVSDCHVPGIPDWKLGVDVDTGCPPSIVAQMLIRGEIAARGVLPPERAVPPEPFFAALAQRGMRITHG